MLSAIIFSPLVGALLLLLVPGERLAALRRGALALSLVPFVLSCVVLAEFHPEEAGFQFAEQVAWIPQWGISYAVGVDGVSLFLVLLTTLLTPLVVLWSWGDVTKRAKAYFMLLLVLETGMSGALLATDLFLFYVFWELMLIPMYLIIGVWGGPRRIYAAVKFVLFTLVGSLLMLVAILYLAAATRAAGPLSFAYERMLALDLTTAEQTWLFAAFALAFAVKVPLFPLHTWLPDAHVEAPTGGSVILAGVLLKMGTYGFLRFALPLFPEAAVQAGPLLVGLAVSGVVYGAVVAMMQSDLKKLVAYSSVSHLGYVMLGLFAFNVEGVVGGLYQMLSHGISTGALFVAVGVIYERRHTRAIAEFGGLWRQVPIYAAIFLVVTLSSVGLPGLNGFVGEFLIMLGAFARWPAATAVAASGVVLAAVYMLWMYQRVMFGPLANPENQNVRDLSMREIAVFAPLVVLILVMGVYPEPFHRRMEPAVTRALAHLEPALAAAAGGPPRHARLPGAPLAEGEDAGRVEPAAGAVPAGAAGRRLEGTP
jgi:NADH-quinone oxidoreductase subunit M